MPKAPAPPKSRGRYWLIAGMWLVIAVSSAFAARTVNSFLKTDPRFTLRAQPPGPLHNDGVTILGAVYTPQASVLQIFARDFGSSVFDVPIAERRRRLLGIDWVEDASVSRVLPNRIVVRIRERRPVAYVNVPHRAFLLVDGEGVLLTPPPRANFGFPVLDGVWIDQSETDRKARVQAALRMLEDLGAAAKDVSEVNAAAADDLRVVTEVQGHAFELWLGDQNFGSRYRNFTDHFADIRAGSPRAGVFDLRIDDRITAK